MAGEALGDKDEDDGVDDKPSLTAVPKTKPRPAAAPKSDDTPDDAPEA